MNYITRTLNKIRFGIIAIALLITLASISLLVCYEANPLNTDTLYLDANQTVLIPAGSVIMYDVVFPSGTIFTGGYETPEGMIQLYSIVPDGETLSLVSGTVVYGDVIIPAGSQFNEGFILPGSRIIIENTISDEVEYGAIIPSGSTLPDSDNTHAYIPDSSVITGSRILVRESFTFPAGTTFPMGYETALPGGTPGEIDNLNPDRGEILLASVPPGSFNASTAENEITIEAGALLLGGAALANNTTMQLPVQLTGSILLLKGKLVPSDGLALPTGSYLPAGALIPSGAILDGESVFPAGTNFQGGYELPDTTVVAPATITSDLNLPAGTEFLGGVLIPLIEPGDGSTGLPGKLYLPGSTQLCQPITFVGEPSAFAKTTTAVVEVNTSAPTTVLIEYTTDPNLESNLQSIEESSDTTFLSVDITGLDPETTYYYRASISGGCGDESTSSARRGFRTTSSCAGDFELVSVGTVYDGWDGRFGTEEESALSIFQMKINPLDNLLYIASSNQSDGLPNLYVSTSDFLGIEEAGLSLSNSAVRNSTALGFQKFGTDNYVYLSFKDNAARGYSLYRWLNNDFATSISVASGEGSGGIGSAYREGFGSASNLWVTDMIGQQLGVDDIMYISVRTSGTLFMADSINGTPGDAQDFTNCTTCGTNNGAGEVWSSGTNNIGALEYAVDSSNNALWIGIGNEGTAGSAELYVIASTDIGTTSPTVNNVNLQGLGTSPEGDVISDIKVLNNDLAISIGDTTGTNGGEIWICQNYAATDCSVNSNWTKIVDFDDGTGLSAADANNTIVMWIRQMPNTGTAYFGTENPTDGALIYSATDLSSNFQPYPSIGCNGFGNSTLINSPTAEVMSTTHKGDNLDILYIGLHKYQIYQQADAASNNVYVYRLIETY